MRFDIHQRVSTLPQRHRHEDDNGEVDEAECPNAYATATAATIGTTSSISTASMVALILLAASVASSSSSSVGVAVGYCSQQHQRRQRRQHQERWQHPLAVSFSSQLSVSSPLVAAAAASVPPPNSRLGRNHLLRQQQLQQQPLMGSLTKRSRSSSSGHQRISSDGIGSAGDDVDRVRSGLRFATYSSYYDQYCSGDVDDCEGGVDDANNSSAASTIGVGDGSGNQTTRVAATMNTTNQQKRLARMLRVSDNARLLVNDRNKSSNRQQRRLKLRSLSRRRMKNHRNDSSTATSSSSMSRLEYERRKAAWAAKYTSVSTLRKSFGSNKNRIWGDFDPSTTRKLYHTLLPRALLELRGLRDGLMSCDEEEEESSGDNGNGKKWKSRHWHRRLWQRKGSLMARNEAINGNDNMDMDDIENITYLQQELKELAPLAFRARLAAKEYARERSRLPARIGSMLYDGYRSWKKYGKWKSTGMTWEQVWNKYEDQVLKEAMMELGMEMPESSVDDAAASTVERLEVTDDLDDEEITARICLRILERSVVTNDAIDRLFLRRLAVDDSVKQQGEGGSRCHMGSGIPEDVIFEESRKRRQRKRKRKLLVQERHRRRKLRIQVDLQAIEKMFDDDIRELLRYSHFSTEDGETRRSKRTGGAFFWKSTSGSISSISGVFGDCDNNTSVTTSTNNSTESSQNLAIEGIADVARGGGSATIINGTASIADAVTEFSEFLAATMLSTTILSSESNVDGITERVSECNPIATTGDNNVEKLLPLRKLSVHEVCALRILATTKERMTLLQESPDPGDPSWEGGRIGENE